MNCSIRRFTIVSRAAVNWCVEWRKTTILITLGVFALGPIRIQVH